MMFSPSPLLAMSQCHDRFSTIAFAHKHAKYKILFPILEDLVGRFPPPFVITTCIIRVIYILPPLINLRTLTYSIPNFKHLWNIFHLVWFSTNRNLKNTALIPSTQIFVSTHQRHVTCPPVNIQALHHPPLALRKIIINSKFVSIS